MFVNIKGSTVSIVLNSNDTSKFKAKAAQKKDKNKAASLSINQIKQYWIALYSVVTSFNPYNVSVNISIKKKLKENTKIIIINSMLIKSNNAVHRDKPKNMNIQNTK